MENVLVAAIIFLLAALSLSTAAVSGLQSQDALAQAQAAANARQVALAGVELAWQSSSIAAQGDQINITLKNTGTVRMADFDAWDVIAQYVGESEQAHMDWVPYEPGTGWQVAQIYLDHERGILESYEPGVVNPNETLVITVPLAEAVQPGTTLQTLVSNEYGVGLVIYAHRNAPPVLDLNAPGAVGVGGTLKLDDTLLLATDVDHLPQHLEYTVLSGPAQGVLTPPTGFTQNMIDSGEVSYTHQMATGGTDMVVFSISDGMDSVGDFTFVIEVSAAPSLVTNEPLLISPGSTLPVGTALLLTQDADNPAGELVYTVQTPPQYGTLNPPSGFSQADIDAGWVTYTSLGGVNDSFTFTVSDGLTVLGPVTFLITVP